MKAIRVHAFGGAENLRLEEIERPTPAAGEVQIQVHAAAILPVDWKIRKGLFGAGSPALPYIPGSAFAGVVSALGAGVSRFQVGQAVFGRTTNGAYAEYTTTAVEHPEQHPFSLVAPKPANISFAQAATISAGATTAWHALFDDGQLQAGQRVLIHAAAGGVGLFAVQLARWKGAYVIASASAANSDYLRSLGAHEVVAYDSVRFEEQVHDIDLVLDALGGSEIVRRSLAVIRPGGRLVSLLPVSEQDQQIAQERDIQANRNQTLPTTHRLVQIAELLAKKQLIPYVQRTYRLEEAAKAQEQSETGHGRGRIVLQIVPE
jgi:NADPH:quinone reductase-like Zn-dependent oxidoreductase